MTDIRRILGPNHNRLLTVVTDETADTFRDNHGRLTGGTVGHTIAALLLDGGWSDYEGPGVAEAGWVVPNTDPALTPKSYRWKR